MRRYFVGDLKDTLNDDTGATSMGDSKSEVWQGTLALMVLETLKAEGSLHGYGIARRIEEISGDALAINYGTLYPALLKLEQEGYVSAEWGRSENNRKAKFYQLTPAGRKRIQEDERAWEQTAETLARFVSLREPSS